MPSALKVAEIKDLNNNILLNNGTLTNNVSFPAGHIVQITHNSKGDENSVYTTSTSHEIVHDSSGNNEWFINVSNITSGNKIFLMFTFTAQAYSSPYDSSFGGYGICRDTISNLVISSSSGSDAGVNTQATNPGVSVYDVITLTAYDTPTAGSHTYYLTHRVINSNYQTRISPDLPTQFFAFEVQQ